MTVVGRRADDRIAEERAKEFVLELSGTMLRRIVLRKEARLERVSLIGARLEEARLPEVHLEGADLSAALLEGADLAGAHLKGATLFGARLERALLQKVGLEGADLFGARLERAYLSEARLERADLRRARLEGADLLQARLEGANLSNARLELAYLGGARLEGANLRQADFWGVNWIGASIGASPAHFADIRTGEALTQAQLNGLIGNEDTLLPDRLNEHREPFYVWSCWEEPPPEIDAIVMLAAGPLASNADREKFRRKLLCSPDNPRRKTGTPLALDAPYPMGHPLGTRERGAGLRGRQAARMIGAATREAVCGRSRSCSTTRRRC